MQYKVNTTALVIGGTKGLGLALAKKAVSLNIEPIILGRTSINSKECPDTAKCISVDILNLDDLCKIEEYVNVNYIVWVAGVFLKNELINTTDHELNVMINLHFKHPIILLRNLLKKRYSASRNPLHLISVASSSSWKLRKKESIYTGIKAAQAAFVRNLAPELILQFPGSKITLINPGGLNTPNFHKDNFLKSGIFLDPEIVANIIWEKALNQKVTFKEWQILRDKQSPNKTNPIIIDGPCVPETLT